MFILSTKYNTRTHADALYCIADIGKTLGKGSRTYTEHSVPWVYRSQTAL